MRGVVRARGYGMNRTIWVTGGAGFLGANLCRRLLREGNRVVCIDDLSSGRMENIEELLQDPGFQFLKHDVAVPFQNEDLPAPERIYHFACPASPVFYQKSHVTTAVTCFEGALNMLREADRHGARILLASTSEIYGEPEVHPQKETYRGNVSTTGPRACYDEGKRISETLFFDFLRDYGTDIRVVRIFNTYGPFMRPDDGRVISNLVVQALKNEPLTISGDGRQTRSFCFVRDLLEGLIRTMETDGITGPINLGNPEELEIRYLAEEVKQLTGCTSSVVYVDRPVDDPTRRKPDIGLAGELLGWTPEIPLKEGLKETIRYFRTCI